MTNDTSSGEPQQPVLPPKPQGSRTGVIAGLGILLVALIAGGVYLFTRDGGDDDATAGAGSNGANDSGDNDDSDNDGGTGAGDGEGDATDDTTDEADSGAGGGETPSETVTVRLGTTDIAQPHWEVLTDLAAAEGIEIELRGFSEYTLPNPALTEGEIDVNSFQHILYLADHNNNTGDDLQPIGPTLIVPLPLYSEQYDSVEQFQDGDQVAIPNDATNQARSLFVLEAAGLIQFSGEPAVPTPDDVDEANSRVVVRPVDASQTAGLIHDPGIAGVVVNNNFASDAGFDLESYVFADDPSSPGAQPYINVFAVRPGDVDNETYQRLAELYHTPEVLELVVESSGGTAVIVDPQEYDAQRLQELQAETEANLSGN